MTLDDRQEEFARGVKSAHNNNYGENIWNAEDYAKSQAKEAILSDLLEIIPKPSVRSGSTLGADTINEDYMRGNNDGYNQYYTELKEKVKKYCE